VNVWSASVPGQENGPGAEPTPGTCTHDHDALSIEAQLLGLCSKPDKAGITVLYRNRVGKFRCQAILDSSADSVEVLNQIDQRLNAGPPIAADHAPAMDVIDARAIRSDMIFTPQDGHDNFRALIPRNDVINCFDFPSLKQ
jgi:hypothetical protein